MTNPTQAQTPAAEDHGHDCDEVASLSIEQEMLRTLLADLVGAVWAHSGPRAPWTAELDEARAFLLPTGDEPRTGDQGRVETFAQVRRERDQLDAVLSEVIDERDRRAELLCEFTEAVERVTYRRFGEFSTTNDPWRRAIDALKGLEA